MLMLAMAVASAASDYYASSTRGSDSNSGTSPDQPFKTLAKLRCVKQLASVSMFDCASVTGHGPLARELQADRTCTLSLHAGGVRWLDGYCVVSPTPIVCAISMRCCCSPHPKLTRACMHNQMHVNDARSKSRYHRHWHGMQSPRARSMQ
jgi:hypothetical protein